MKNKFLTICIILAVILSVMSFTAILMPRNSTSDEPTETVETLPEIKTARIHYSTGYSCTIIYYEGLTWSEWYNSEFNVFPNEFSVYDDYVSYCGCNLRGAVADDETGEVMETYGEVHPNDVITYSCYSD